MALVGAVAVRWTEVETQLEVLLFGALSPAWIQPGGAVGTEGNWIARVPTGYPSKRSGTPVAWLMASSITSDGSRRA